MTATPSVLSEQIFFARAKDRFLTPRSSCLYMWLRAQTVNCNSDYRKQIVSAYIIENPGEVEERFSYEVRFNSATWLSLVAYSQANYGLEAVFRLMTEAEKADFIASR
jgi:hypothetical protein